MCTRGKGGSWVQDLFTVEGRINGHRCRILIDCGANCNFMSEEFARHWNLLTNRECGNVEMADGHVTGSQARLCKVVTLQVKQHREQIQLTATSLKNDYDLLLGIPWLKDHDPSVASSGEELVFLCC